MTHTSTNTEQVAHRATVEVPQGFTLVPMELLDRATESLGSFVSDHGWGQADMDTFDDLSALAAAPQPPEAAPVQMPEPWGHCVGGNVFVSRNLPAHIKPMVDSGEFKDIKLYTGEQVRQLLAAHGIK